MTTTTSPSPDNRLNLNYQQPPPRKVQIPPGILDIPNHPGTPTPTQPIPHPPNPTATPPLPPTHPPHPPRPPPKTQIPRRPPFPRRPRLKPRHPQARRKILQRLETPPRNLPLRTRRKILQIPRRPRNHAPLGNLPRRSTHPGHR